MEIKKTTIKWIAIGVLILTLCGISFFVGTNQNNEPKAGYQYIQSEYLDSLEVISAKHFLLFDSINGELNPQRVDIDTTTFLSDERVEEIVKESYDELYNQTPSRIDTLFIHEYDSAVTARRLYYNGQR